MNIEKYMTQDEFIDIVLFELYEMPSTDQIKKYLQLDLLENLQEDEIEELAEGIIDKYKDRAERAIQEAMEEYKAEMAYMEHEFYRSRGI